MPVMNPDIVSPWAPADETQNRLELAETEVPSLFAIRDTYDRSKVVFATKEQILALATTVGDERSPLGQLIMNGNGHSPRSGRQRPLS